MITVPGEARSGEGDAADRPGAADIVNALPHPLLCIGEDDRIVAANDAAEQFFRLGRVMLKRQKLSALVPFGSPLLPLVAQCRARRASFNEYRLDLGTPQQRADRVVDVYVAPVPGFPGCVTVMLQERTMADKIERQLTHRGAARSVSGLAAMLAHEIKNPLSGIRGAAQLLDADVSEDDRALTRLITDETDRIVKLVDRMEVFSDERPIEREAVNMHSVLEHVKRLAKTGFARDIQIKERYDPSLPSVYGNRDQLIQIFINLIKNASEAFDNTNINNAEITLTSSFQPGIRILVPASRHKVSLPLEFCVLDNGPGVAPDIQAHMFDPFVTSKTSGSGLGLALVAKIVGDHGGVVECDSQPGRTAFRVLLPMYDPDQTTNEETE